MFTVPLDLLADPGPHRQVPHQQGLDVRPGDVGEVRGGRIAPFLAGPQEVGVDAAGAGVFLRRRRELLVLFLGYQPGTVAIDPADM